MEKTHQEKQAQKLPQQAKPLLWDCGSTLYDSCELKSFERQLYSAINSRSFSMPHLAERRLVTGVAAPVPASPPPVVSKKPSKISRLLHKFLKSVFKPKQNSSLVFRIHEGHHEEYYAVNEKSGTLTTILEVPEIDFGGFSPEVNPLAKRATASARFSATTVGISSCA
uniref:Uncharacterized protein n=1 Tax=Rhizophora mucronata TaxID=61149 RepID=A0A2P2N3L0_RHIMU